MEKQVTEVRKIVEHLLEEEDVFIVDVELKGIINNQRLLITIDSGNGVTIEDCVQLSRALSNELEESDLIEGKYNLEVSSPGADQPLTDRKQYSRHLGRELKVFLNNESEKEVKLVSVEENFIEVKELMKTKNPKIRQFKQKTTSIDFSDIKMSKVIITC